MAVHDLHGERSAVMTSDSGAGRAGTVVRRIILFAILYALVVIAAIGLSGLLERVIGASRVLAADDAGLARSLAFTFIGAPVAGALWWWERRKLADPAERASLVWALYLTAATLTSLIVSTASLAAAAVGGIDGEWRPGDLSAGVVWAAVWIWHRHMRRSAATAPARLSDLPVELSALYGLVVAASGAITAIAVLLSEALTGVVPVLVDSRPWVVPVLQALVWGVVGALVWWWHWFRERAKDAQGSFALVLLVSVVGAATATTLFALGTALFVLLRVLFDTDPVAEIVAPLDTAIAAALIGALVWVYHARVLVGRSAKARGAARLVISAVALIGAASGFGVVVNALLATLGPTLVDDDPRTLLLGGISALVIGAPVWWVTWRPAQELTDEDAADPARRVYLVVVFGVSALVAIVTLLIIGYRVFELLLDAGGRAGLVERIRAPFGLLSATAVVFGYHFSIWRRSRGIAASTAAARQPAIARIVLVAGGDTGDLAARLRAETGAAVTAWHAADDDALLGDEDVPALLASLAGLSAPRVLVVAEPGGGARVVPLAD